MNTAVNQGTGADAQEQTRAAQNYVTPGVNIRETAEDYVLQAELPGVNKEGLEITLEGNELTLVGRRQRGELKTPALYRESSTADYRRVFELNPAIDAARIDAKIEQGVLTVRLPKSDRVKPRKITVND
jgi:HSP20 family protein